MQRRHFLKAAVGVVALGIPKSLGAQGLVESDPPAVGENMIRVVHSGPEGRIILTDSSSYLLNKSGTEDVVVSSSFAGAVAAATTLLTGPRAAILHDAGIGLDQAGISGLPFMERYDVPCAAVASASATLSNGNSLYEGTISSVNDLARKLGVEPGQPAREAAMNLLKAKPGRKIQARGEVDDKLYELEVASKGRILAIWGLPYLGKGEFPNDVFALATHSARVAAEHAFRWNVKAWVANDAGPGKNNSGIDGLSICGDKGMPAAAVSAMSARIGDAMSTWNTGIISAANEPAKAKGVMVGMTAKEALRMMNA